MASFGVIDTYLTYQFLVRLTKPYTKWKAFKTGVIDDKGNIIVPQEKRTTEQKDSFKYYDLLVLNLRKLLAKLPGGSTKLATYSAALFLLRELDEKKNLNLETLEEDFSKFITEEIANTANPENIAGLDEPPKFMGHRIFDVSMDALMKSRHGKDPRKRYAKYLKDEECLQDVREYCKKNPKKSVILRDGKSGQMMFLRRK